jgi:uncharacterized protein YbaR (Trm112 family)
MTNGTQAIPSAIRALLACPKCRGALTDGVLGEKSARPTAEALVCGRCGLAFPVEEGIPVLLIERATPCATAV